MSTIGTLSRKRQARKNADKNFLASIQTESSDFSNFPKSRDAFLKEYGDSEKYMNMLWSTFFDLFDAYEVETAKHKVKIAKHKPSVYKT